MPRISLAAIALCFVGCDPGPSVTGVWCQFPVDCHSPNACSFSRCRSACTTGDDCPTHLCLAGHCSVPQDFGCASEPGRTCNGMLSCADDRCTLRCNGTCAGGGVCRPATDHAFSICVAPDEPPYDADARDGG